MNTIKIRNPASEELIRELPTDNQLSINQKYNQLKSGQTAWAKQSLSTRREIIQKFVTLLLQNKDQLAHDLHLETGKPLNEAINEINGACYRIQFFLDHAEAMLQEKCLNQSNGVKEILSFDPLGIVGNISAWNYPYLVGVNVFIPALLSGNAVLYKPSEYATLTGIHIEKLLYEAGVPNNVFVTVLGDGSSAQHLLDLPLDGYFFTGSYKTGKSIADAVAHKRVPIVLEMGGKDPVYVMDDVKDITAAAKGLVEGVFYNNGQSCCAVERIYVHEKIYAEFVPAFLNEAKQIKQIPPLTRPQQIALLEDQVQDAVVKGAKVLLGGNRATQKGAYFSPTILTDVNHTMKVMKDESFGPIIGIQKVNSDQEALELMQDTEYGLTAGVYGSNEERARNILNQLDVGTGYFNCCDRVSPYLPWSGRRHSGMGLTLSHLGILTFVKPKAYMFKT